MNNYPFINITQHAEKVNSEMIYFKCPICKKSPYSKKSATHTFQSLGNKDNRVEIHNTKCLGLDCIFFIHITNETIKEY